MFISKSVLLTINESEHCIYFKTQILAYERQAQIRSKIVHL